MDKIKGLLFDLDGVITDTAEYHYLAWKNLATSLKIEFTREFNENLKGISRMESLEKILKLGHKNKVINQEQKNTLAEIKNSEYVALIDEVSANDILPGIEKLLKEAQNLGLKMVLTSASKNGPRLLEKLGLSQYFDEVIDPGTLKKGKPAPEIYLLGAKVLGLEPEECIGFEDAYSGVESINAAGIYSVGIGAPEILSEADYIVKSTSELDLAMILIEANKDSK